jgi:hypothetical protein
MKGNRQILVTYLSMQTGAQPEDDFYLFCGLPVAVITPAACGMCHVPAVVHTGRQLGKPLEKLKVQRLLSTAMLLLVHSVNVHLCCCLAVPCCHPLHHRLTQQLPTAQAGIGHHSDACCGTGCAQLRLLPLWMYLKLQRATAARGGLVSLSALLAHSVVTVRSVTSLALAAHIIKGPHQDSVATDSRWMVCPATVFFPSCQRRS